MLNTLTQSLTPPLSQCYRNAESPTSKCEGDLSEGTGRRAPTAGGQTDAQGAILQVTSGT